MPTYTELYDAITQKTIIYRVDEGGLETWIPADENNSDYRAYLAWLEQNSV